MEGKRKRKAQVRWFGDLTSKDATDVGGKNSSLGEMVRKLKRQKIRVPDGFATTAEAYWRFVEENDLADRLKRCLAALEKKPDDLRRIGKEIRSMFQRGEFPDDLEQEIRRAYRELSRRAGQKNLKVAVRSSATAEDLPSASFAGQQESYLNISGEKNVLDACRKCFASLFTDRAISYRNEKGFDHLKVALSAGVQQIVRSDMGSAGVLFTLDTESGFPRVVSINGAWGLGEVVVKGTVTPDEFTVFKPLLGKKRPIIEKKLGTKEKKLVFARGGGKTTRHTDTPAKDRGRFCLEDEEILQLAKWGAAIEKHYRRPMDIEWAKDGRTGELHIVQARPETVHSGKTTQALKHYRLKDRGKKLVDGLSIGDAISAGKVCRITSASDIGRFREGTILVTGMTDPDWVAIMKKSRGIITDLGGRTSHAAIVSRELGIPAVVGTGDATEKLSDGQEVTLSCAEGSKGFIYQGSLQYDEIEVEPEKLPKTRTRIMLNLANPDAAFQWWRLPADGVGLARMEFIINNAIKIHPMALVRWKDLKDKKVRREIDRLTARHPDKAEYFVDHLARGIGKIAAFAHPDPVIVRMSDFKTSEYADLIGGAAFEPKEDNPMLGFRGASRYYSDRYEAGFALECKALRKVREEMGFTNLVVMIPFCRTVSEAENVLKVMSRYGLRKGRQGLQVYVMCEIPSNVILADHFADHFDGFSIGSNDLTQLILGIDRNSRELANLFDERNEAVTRAIADLIRTARKKHRKVGICGEAPSNYPDFARFLVEHRIDSISLSPDSFIDIKRQTARLEKKQK